MKPTRVLVDRWVSFPDTKTDAWYCRPNTENILIFYNIETKEETKNPSRCEILMTKAFISLAPFDPEPGNMKGVGYKKKHGQHIFYPRSSLALVMNGNHLLTKIAEAPRRILPGDIGLTFTLAGRFHSPVEGIPYNVRKIKLYYEVDPMAGSMEEQQCTS